jgi:elongation factor P
MKVQANTVRIGNVLEREGKLWVVLGTQIVQPGKGGAFIQVEMKDMKTGTKTTDRYRTGETLERALLEDRDFTYLFADGDSHTFMDVETFEQLPVSVEVIGEQKVPFLQENMAVQIALHEGIPLSVTMPKTVTLTITEADPVVKGQTASSSYKPAVLENGVRVLVPPFIDTGERIVVNIEESATYVERAKG